MKKKMNVWALLLVIAAMAFGRPALALEETKRYNESWPATSVQTLEVENKFGEVKVTNQGGADVTIDVVVTVEAPNRSKARELLGQINVRFSESGGTVRAETRLDSDFKSRNDFSIDYLVNIPTDKKLDISNKYGNTFVNVLNASGKFDVQYGNFLANELNTPANGSMELLLAYGKGDVSLSNDLTVKVKYSTVNFGQVSELDLESKYTVINLGEARSVKARSKYDTFNFEVVGSLSATTKYTHIKVDELIEDFDAEAEYGGIRIGEIDPAFGSVNITNSYGQVHLGLGAASYTIDASCNFCDIDYPEGNFSGNSEKDNHANTLQGKIGTGNGGRVVVKSRYGQIKLN